jgi:hypothetical protein
VEADRESELDPREQQCIGVMKHGVILALRRRARR